MESIEIGEYIRTKQGDISKVNYVDEENIFLETTVWSKNDLYEKPMYYWGKVALEELLEEK